VNDASRRAQEDVDHARAMSAQIERELQNLQKTIDPARRVVDPNELRLMTERSAWIDKQYKAEQEVFMAENGTPGIVGSHGIYQWFTSVDHDISTLLRLCPGVVLDKYLAVTSIDGGVLHLTAQEKSEGWWTADGAIVYSVAPDGSRDGGHSGAVAYSPRVASIHGLPDQTHDECCAGFDEWYVFEEPVPPGEIEVFVNWMGFRLFDPVWQWAIDRFWEQMARLAPESYLAQGAVFTFATRNANLFTNVLAAFSAHRA
jgi:hypothetical protein